MASTNVPVDPGGGDATLGNALCCKYCAPMAYVWMDTTSTSVFVENSITETRHLDVQRHLDTHANADANDTSSDSGTDIDDHIIKDVELRRNQGKVYRTDTYTAPTTTATLTVADCRSTVVTQSNTVPRP